MDQDSEHGTHVCVEEMQYTEREEEEQDKHTAHQEVEEPRTPREPGARGGGMRSETLIVSLQDHTT